LTEFESRKVLENILEELNVENGDCIMLGIDMGRLPLPAYPAALNKEAFREREEKWCEFVLNVLMDTLGEKGTLLVPSYSYSCTRPGTIFSTETTRSEVGPFTDYFRKQAGVIRSIHPIFSIAAKGAHAEAILSNVSRAAFGTNTPFARFQQYKVKFLCLGVEIKNAITYIHHMEQLSGCPHRFSKSFNIEVHTKDTQFTAEWTAFLNYRGIDYHSDITSLQKALMDAGTLQQKNMEW